MTIKNLDRFWDIDTLGIAEDSQTSNLTREEDEAQTLQNSVTFYDKANKTWYTSLLWKTNPPNLGNNKRKALAILNQVENGALKRGSVAAVNQAFQDMIDGGFAEEVTEETEPQNVHYLPGHAVYREDHDTTKTRIVLNGASVTQSGKSINDCLHQGRCLLPEINHVLIRWRMYLIAFILDISKMFLRIKIQHGKDYLRFFWRYCEKSLPPRIFRMISVTFGMVSSPFQAIDVVLKHADMLQDVLPLASTEVRRQIYMDDVPGGDNELEQAKKKIEELWKFFLEANMMPHKFASNNADILGCIPVENQNPKTQIKVLGVLWDTKTDQLMFNIQLPEKMKSTTNPAMQLSSLLNDDLNRTENIYLNRYNDTTNTENTDQSELPMHGFSTNYDTKRSFLETSATIFDPLGLLTPFVMKIKLLFQKVWLSEEKEQTKTRKGWDTRLPQEIQTEWNAIKEEIPTLNTIKIRRCFFSEDQKTPIKMSIFAFGDASIKAYATAIYLVGQHEDGSYSTNLVLSKSRIAPKKMVEQKEDTFSIVRLELLSALITSRAVVYVQKAFAGIYTITETFCFTDSLINLCRIKNGPSKYKIWVGNRIAEILTHTKADQWKHCAGIHNPADIPSRGADAEELKSSKLWWYGPDFMTKPQTEWPTDAEYKVSNDPEESKNKSEEINFRDLFFANVSSRKESQKCLTINFSFVETLISRFESWYKTIKFISIILRLVSKDHKQFIKMPFSLEEKKKTEHLLWSLTQRHHFQEEFGRLLNKLPIPEKSALLIYNPQMDFVDYIIKSNTRLRLSGLPDETRIAIILPKNCPIVAKYIMDRHVQHQHAKTGYLHALLKDKFILPQGRNQIRKTIHKCTKRYCVSPRPLSQQEAPLPALRTDNPGPFINVACDLFGHLFVHHKCGIDECPHQPESKVYVALFTCFHSRAIHLEIVENTGTECFLNAFRSFTARRGTPSTMYADNAKGFKAASKELRALYRSINWNTVKNEGTNRDINWFFSCERAPHQNGLCERLVRTVKHPLKIACGSAKLTLPQLRIILTELEAIINNRPLGVTSNNENDFTPITPMELVNGRRLNQMPDPNNRMDVTSFPHLWRKRKSILNGFWNRWQKTYLLEQNVRRKWKTPTTDDLLNKIVLIREDNKLSRNEWKIGRIITIHPSKDGLIRNVTVKTAEQTLRRPVQKLALFENF